VRDWIDNTTTTPVTCSTGCLSVSMSPLRDPPPLRVPISPLFSRVEPYHTPNILTHNTVFDSIQIKMKSLSHMITLSGIILTLHSAYSCLHYRELVGSHTSQPPLDVVIEVSSPHSSPVYCLYCGCCTHV